MGKHKNVSLYNRLFQYVKKKRDHMRQWKCLLYRWILHWVCWWYFYVFTSPETEKKTSKSISMAADLKQKNTKKEVLTTNFHLPVHVSWSKCLNGRFKYTYTFKVLKPFFCVAHKFSNLRPFVFHRDFFFILRAFVHYFEGGYFCCWKQRNHD